MLKLFLLLLLVILPLGAIVRINPMDSVYIYPLDVLLGLIFAYSIFISYKTKKIAYLKTTIAFAFFCLFSLISLVVNINLLKLNILTFLISLSYLIRYIAIFSVFYVSYFLDSSFKKKCLLYLSLSTFIFVLIGMSQYFFFSDLRPLTYLGWDEHLYRLFSTFFDPNFTGSFLILSLFLFLYLLNKFKEKLKFFYLFAIFLTLISIFLTYSRSSYTALIISGIVYLIYLGRKKILVPFLVVVLLGILIVPHDLKSEGVNVLRTASIVARGESYKTGLRVFNKSPLIGSGFNSFRYAQNKYGFLTDKKWKSSNAGAGVANSYIFLLATSGIFGTLLFFNFVRIFITSVFEDIDRERRGLFLGVITAVLVQGLFENTIFFPFIACFLFLLSGLLTSENVDHKS